MTSCRPIAWPSGLRCLLGVPAKARARNPLTSTSEPQRGCPSAGPTASPTNSWLIWPTGQRRTCALSARTCCASRGRGSPTTLPDRRPLCRETNVWKLWESLELVEKMKKKILRICRSKLSSRSVHHVLFLSYTSLFSYFRGSSSSNSTQTSFCKVEPSLYGTVFHLLPVFCPLLCKYQLHLMFWPSKGEAVTLSPLCMYACVCMCARVCMIFCLFSYVCIGYTSALPGTQQQQAGSQRRIVFFFKKRSWFITKPYTYASAEGRSQKERDAAFLATCLNS